MESSVRLNKKKMFCLKLLGAFIFLCASVCLEMADFFFSSFFFLFCQKWAIFLQIWKSKCKLLWPALSDSNLVSSRHPNQFSAPFLAAQTNYTGQQWSQQVVTKKKDLKRKRGGGTHSTHVFETLESFEIEHFFFFFSLGGEWYGEHLFFF